jgi:hypothetical protein
LFYIVVNFLFEWHLRWQSTRVKSDTEQCWGIFSISGLLPWSAVCCYLTGHKQCKHQDFQWPRSRWIHAKRGI